MDSMKLRSRVGADGVLNLKVPIGVTDAEVDVVVVFQLVEHAQTPEARGWPAGFFEQTAGAWSGEPLMRGEQGDYEERDELAIHEEPAVYAPQGDK